MVNAMLKKLFVIFMQVLEAVVRHFQQQPDVDPDRVVLLGSSQGA